MTKCQHLRLLRSQDKGLLFFYKVYVCVLVRFWYSLEWFRKEIPIMAWSLWFIKTERPVLEREWMQGTLHIGGAAKDIFAVVSKGTRKKSISPVQQPGNIAIYLGLLVTKEKGTSMKLGFPHSSVGKESACNAGDPSLIAGSGRSTGEGKGYLLQVSWASLWLSGQRIHLQCRRPGF